MFDFYAKSIHAVVEGHKPFEIRKEDDCRYEVGDLLVLREWMPGVGEYTDATIVALITYVMRDAEFLAPGYVALGLRLLDSGARLP